MTLPDAELARRRTVIVRNAEAFSKRVPIVLQKEQRGLAREVQRRQYADNDVKALGLLYDYVDRVMAMAKGSVACKRGCSTCCHSEIALWQPEADLIAAKTGLPVRRIQLEPARRTTPYATTNAPCPFLANGGACSIYALRPLVCRTMVNFDADSTICQFEHRDNTPIPMMDRATSFAGVYEAYNIILKRNGGGAGDIREFFGESIDHQQMHGVR